MYTYIPEGVCSKEIQVQVENGVIVSVNFVAGCPGNLSAISKLVQGMAVADVIAKLKGNLCGDRRTSCADQLARALEQSGQHPAAG